MKSSLLLLLLGIALFGCVDRSLSPTDTNDDRSRRPGCSGIRPSCVDSCGSDWLQSQARCEDDDWTCPSPLRRTDQCPPGTCQGLPLPGETCGPSGWMCKPPAAVFQGCPQLICAECSGLPTPVTMSGCTCGCDKNGQVSCHRAGTTLDPTAELFFMYTAGFSGAGGGVEVVGDGTVHGWFANPSNVMGPPDFTGTLALADVADLFARIATVDLGALPHGGTSGECNVSAFVRACDTCEERLLDYSGATQVLPEMNAVWKWFAEHTKDSIGVSDFSPAQYCAF